MIADSKDEAKVENLNKNQSSNWKKKKNAAMAELKLSFFVVEYRRKIIERRII
jgi:hypothetical protein